MLSLKTIMKRAVYIKKAEFVILKLTFRIYLICFFYSRVTIRKLYNVS